MGTAGCAKAPEQGKEEAGQGQPSPDLALHSHFCSHSPQRFLGWPPVAGMQPWHHEHHAGRPRTVVHRRQVHTLFPFATLLLCRTESSQCLLVQKLLDSSTEPSAHCWSHTDPSRSCLFTQLCPIPVFLLPSSFSASEVFPSPLLHYALGSTLLLMWHWEGIVGLQHLPAASCPKGCTQPGL